MKNYTALALLSLTLAACSQGTTTPSTTPSTAAGHGVVPYDASRPVYPNTQAAYDALVAADLNILSSQALTPQVYLNVLPVAGSADSVRAYVKSTFPSPAVCDLNFGDNSSVVRMTSPTTGRILTVDHPFSSYGTYTVNVTCRDNGAVLGSRSVTIRAGRQSILSGTVLTFENPPAPAGFYNGYITYQESGFTFSNTSDMVYQFAQDFGGTGSYNLGDSQTLYASTYNDSLSLRASGGAPFTLTSLETREIFHGQVNDYTITGHRADGTTVTTQTHEVPDAGSTVIFGASWTNLTSVTFGSPGNIILDNINVTPGILD